MPDHFKEFELVGTYMRETRESIIARNHQEKRDAVAEQTTPIRALCVVVNTSINDVLRENAMLRAQAEKMEHELEVWCGGATLPEVGRYYAIYNSVLGIPGCRGAFWGDDLDCTEVDRELLATHGVVGTETHSPGHFLPFRYLGAHAEEYVQQQRNGFPCEHFVDRKHSFAAPYLGATLDFDHDAEECPSMYTEDGLAVVHIRQIDLHRVWPLDEGTSEVHPTGAEGVYGQLPKWLAWYKKTRA